MIDNIYSEKIKIYSSNVDVNSTLRFDAILSYFQDLTTSHSTLMKIDHDNLMASSNAFWVLSKIKFKVDGIFKTGAELLGSTWPLKPGLIRFLRDYKITANCGEINGKSEWCILDADSLALRKSSTITYPEFEHIEERSQVGDFSRLNVETSKSELIYSYKTLFTDIDCNNHVNNLSYARMALNAFTVDEFTLHNFNAFEIHFISQAYYGDCIDIFKANTDIGVFVEGKIDNKTIFKCLFYNE